MTLVSNIVFCCLVENRVLAVCKGSGNYCSSSQYYKSSIRASSENGLYIVFGSPFLVLFWRSKKEHTNRQWLCLSNMHSYKNLFRDQNYRSNHNKSN